MCMTQESTGGIILLIQVLILFEGILDARTRRRVKGDFGEED